MSVTEPPWPLNELARIDKLKGYCVLDTPPDPVFDRLTQLATRHFRMPTVLVSLVDESRQWFKSRYGFEAQHVPRRLAFCAYAILTDEVMVVRDATRDERFVGNDLVTGPPFIRFYAGAPLRTPEGLLLGTFCVIDDQPHPDFDEQSRSDLEEFARIVMHELEMRTVQRAAEAARQAEAEARAAAEQAEARYRMLVENAPQLMWVNRPNGLAEFFNLAWRTYTGQETVEGTRWDAVHPDDRERIQELRDRAVAAGEPYEYELRLRRADRVYRWHIGRVSPLRQDGRIVAWVGTAMDVDDIHRARELAEEANRSKSRFLASASHDLRQPMQSTLLFAEVLRGHVPDPAGRDALDHLQQGLDTLKGLLDGLLDVSRLDAGIVQPQFEDIPVGEIIGPLAAAYTPIAQAKGLAWQVGPCEAVVRSDRVLLGRMVRNLIENAIRYTQRGTVALACTTEGERLRIEVCDTGIGIPPDQLGRIFEEFYQVGNPERDRAQGLGLGLAIVRRLSALLDHPVRAQSRPGGGSVFTVEVPLAAGPPRAAVPPPSVPPRPDPATGSGRFAVAVDDDVIVLLALKTMLQEWGYEVLTAASTDEAVERLRTAGRKPDIVLADYRLREGRVGTEAVVRIREMHGADVPGIIVTGEIGPEPQTDAVQHGLGLLHKPVTPRLLAAALARYRQEAP